MPYHLISYQTTFTYKTLNSFIIEKLENGLGLLKMTLPDLHQDAVVLGPMLQQNSRHDIKLKDRSHLCRDRKQH
jgi:hypothetical protein